MGSKLNVVIVDYDKGNIKSLENAINHVGDFDIKITADSDLILRADIIILPGVGAFPDAMQKLKERNVLSVLHEAVMTNKTPTLGICLGMQLLFDSSEEKVLTDGLGWIPGKVVHMETLSNLRVPHIGWNSLILNKHDVLFSFLDHDKDFYFVHSLHAVCEERFVLAECDYGDSMIAAVQRDNVVGMQFHPEKSQKNGLNLIKYFLNWSPQ